MSYNGEHGLMAVSIFMPSCNNMLALIFRIFLLFYLATAPIIDVIFYFLNIFNPLFLLTVVVIFIVSFCNFKRFNLCNALFTTANYNL